MQQLSEEKNLTAEEIIDLGHYFKILKRNWLFIFITAFILTGVTSVILFFVTPRYTATATLLIEAKEKKVVSIEEVVAIDATQDEYYLTQFEILKSNRIAQKVIDDLKLAEREEFNASLRSEKSLLDTVKAMPLIASLVKSEADELPTDESIRQSVLKAFKENLVITPVTRTQLVKISFTSEDPELAANVANAVGYAYIDLNLEARILTTEHATSWITNRLVELRNKLAASERALSDFLAQEQLIDDSGIDQLASQELANLTERLAEVRDIRIEMESAFTALGSSNIADVSSLASVPTISEHPQVIAIREAEIEAQKEVQELSKRYGPKHDKMKAGKAKLKAIQDQATSFTTKLISGLGKELQAMRKQEALITKEINSLKSEFQVLTVKKSKYEALKREVATNRNVLNVFLTRQKETTATGDFHAANARFADQALVPQEPSAPNKKLIVALVFIVSAGFAVVMVFISDAMKNTIESVADFEQRFGLGPVGGIPLVKATGFKRKSLDNRLLFDNSDIRFRESICSIRTSIMLSFKQNNVKRLSVTSALPEEGKSTVAINLAASMAKVEKVVLIDCDLRNPSVAKRLGFKKELPGLTNLLSGGADLKDCLLSDSASGLTILPAGMPVPNPQELLCSVQFEELLSKLDSEYDRIIIDTPPTLSISDSLIVGTNTAATFLVIKANSTRQDTLKSAISKLAAHNISVSGVIVNQINSKSAQKEYSCNDFSKYNEIPQI